MTKIRYRIAIFLLVLTPLFVGPWARADEPLPDIDDDPPPSTSKDAPAARSDKPNADERSVETPVDPQDDKLLRALDPAAKQMESEIERMERAIEAMRRASERIGADDTGKDTRDLQQKVIKDLEELLKFLKSQQQNSQQSQQQNQDQQQQQQKQRQQLRKPQLDPQNSGRQQPKPQDGKNQPDRSNADKARDSQDRLDPSRAKPTDEARRAQMVKDVWGHLPPQLREALQQSFSEKYLPRYEELVKRYYEALAEKNRKRSPPQGF